MIDHFKAWEMCREVGSVAQLKLEPLKRRNTSSEAEVKEKRIRMDFNNVELERREFWKDHQDSKQGTKLLPNDEGQGQGLKKRVGKSQNSFCRKCQRGSA